MSPHPSHVIDPATGQQPGYAPGAAPPKTPGLAAMLSVVPGLGNVYNGLYTRGVAFFLIYAGLFAMAVGTERDSDLAFLVPSMVFFWFFNIFDAYRQANLINYGYLREPGLSLARPEEQSTGGVLVPGILLVVLGFYGVLRRYFDIDLEWLLDLWPFGLMAFGGFLIWQAVGRRRGDDTAPAGEES